MLLDRLSEQVYLHSNPDNFAKVTAGYRFSFMSEDTKVPAQLEQCKQKIVNQINSITKLCNDFYASLGFENHDIVNLSSSNPFNLAGAREFQRRFLQMSAEGKDSATATLLSIMNTAAYQEECIRRIQQQKFQGGTVQRSGELQSLILEIAGRLSSIIKYAKGTEEITTAAVSEIIQTIFQNEKGERGIRISLRKSVLDRLGRIKAENRSEALRTIFFPDGDNIDLSKDSAVNAAKKRFQEYFLGEVTQNDIVPILYEVLKEHAKRRGVKLPSNSGHFKRDFEDFFRKSLRNYGAVDFTTNRPQFTGFLLEQPFEFGMKMDLKKILDNTIKLISVGQTQETRIFKDGSTSTRLSGSDFIFEVTDKKSGEKKTYRIQAKNSLQSKDFLSVRLQSADLPLETYVKRIFGNDRDGKVLEYLLLNKAFLSQYGLESGGGKAGSVTQNKERKNYGKTINRYDDVEKYVLFILNQTLAFLIGGQMYNEADNWDISRQNLFFIYKGKYLIPVSLFLYSAYALIVELQRLVQRKTESNGLESEQLNTIGRLTYSKKLKDVNLGGIAAARKLQLDKFGILNTRGLLYEETEMMKESKTKPLRYPPSLIAIGSNASRTLLSKVKLSSINFVMYLKEIDRYLK